MRQLVEFGLSNAALATLCATAVVILTATRLVRSPALRHALWLLVMARLVMPPLWVWPIALDVASPSEPRSEAVVAPEPPQPQPPETLADAPRNPGPYLVLFEPDEEVASVPIPLRFVATSDPEASRVTTPAPAASEPNEVVAPASAFPRIASWTLLGGVWIAGAVVSLAVAARRVARFSKLLQTATPATPEMKALVASLAARFGLRRQPITLVVNASTAPMLWAVAGPPKLIIPAELWSRLAADGRAALVAHELAHLKRGDHRVRLFELVVRALHWWNPVATAACRALRAAEEEACDAWVVWAFPDNVRCYANTLLDTIDFLSHAGAAAPLGSGLGPVGPLKRRLTIILRDHASRRMTIVAKAAVLSLATVLLPLAPGLAAAPRKYVADDDAKPAEAEKKADPDKKGDYEITIKRSDEDFATHLVPGSSRQFRAATFAVDDFVRQSGAAAEKDKSSAADQINIVLEGAEQIGDDAKRIQVKVHAKTQEGLREALARLESDLKQMKEKKDPSNADRVKIKVYENLIQNFRNSIAQAEAAEKNEGHAMVRFYAVVDKDLMRMQEKVEALQREVDQKMRELHTAHIALNELRMKLSQDAGGGPRHGLMITKPATPTPSGPVTTFRAIPAEPANAAYRLTRVTPPSATDKRLDDLEKKFDLLLNEIKSLKSEKK